MSTVLEFDYNPRPSRMVLGVVFFGLGAVFMLHEAWTNTKGLVIDRLIYFSPANANIVYGVMTAVSAGMAIAALLGLFRALWGGGKLWISHGIVEITSPFWGRTKRVAFSQIGKMTIGRRNRQRNLTVITDGGKFWIAEAMLPKGISLEYIARKILDPGEAPASTVADIAADAAMRPVLSPNR